MIDETTANHDDSIHNEPQKVSINKSAARQFKTKRTKMARHNDSIYSSEDKFKSPKSKAKSKLIHKKKAVQKVESIE